MVEEVREFVTKMPPPPDYDMEEGEIVDDEGPLVSEPEKKVGSDVESGEFNAADVRSDLDDSHMSVDADLENDGSNHNLMRTESSRKSTKYLKPHGSEHSGESKGVGRHSHHDELPVLERMANGDLDSRSRKGESRSHTKRKSPLRESSKDKDQHMSESKQQVLESARGGEKAKDKRGERSSSYHRSSVRESKHEDGDSRDKETEEKKYRDKKRVERDSTIERSERDWAKERDRIWGRDHEREKDAVRDREIPRDTKSDMDRNKDYIGSRDRDIEKERERRREKDRGRSRDRDLEWERRRDDSILTYKDKDAEREWDKVRDRSRKLEMDKGRDRFSGRDRHRDQARDDESDRNRRYHKYDDRDDLYGDRDRRRGYDEEEYGKDRKTKHSLDKDQASKDSFLKENEDGINGDDDNKDYQETLGLKPPEHEEDDVDRIKEESRRRREAILQKYKAKQSQQQPQAVPQVLKEEELKEQPSQKLASASAVQGENNGVKGDGEDIFGVETSSNLGKFALGVDSTAAESNVALGEGSPKSECSNDMFRDDIFGDSPAGVRKMGKGDGLPLERSGLHDNWDDPEGYYSFRFGEILDSRYEITAAHGKGVFSTVVRAKDLKAGSGDPEEVAIKIIRNNETMLKAGTEELVILKKLVGADPDDRRHCVRYLSHFKYRNHLCIVFESLHMNLREVLKKFGRNIGLKLTAVRTYSKQLFIALKHLRNCGVLHCDIKPDNMLVNDSKNVLKLCDFGNAMFAGKNEITPYLVSRFYRAPEIILGLPYDHPMDMWSVGCCLYELYTGKVLFPGPSNNDMLRLHMELKGSFPKKMLRKGAFIEQHFDQDLNFLATEEDPVTKKTIRKLIVNIKPKDIGNIIRGSPGEDTKMLANFKDLLDKIFVLDPDKRLTVSQALTHPFITGK